MKVRNKPYNKNKVLGASLFFSWPRYLSHQKIRSRFQQPEACFNRLRGLAVIEMRSIGLNMRYHIAPKTTICSIVGDALPPFCSIVIANAWACINSGNFLAFCKESLASKTPMFIGLPFTNAHN